MSDELIRLGLVEDDDIDLDEAALVLALLDHPDVDPAPYRDDLERIAVRLAKVDAATGDPHARADALSLILGASLGL